MRETVRSRRDAARHMDTAAAYAVKDAVVELAEAATGAGNPLADVSVEDSWPAGRINSRDTVIVADITGAIAPATMRAGGGTRTDTFRLEVACAAVRKTGKTRPVRDRAGAIAAAVERLVLDEGNKRPAFGLNGVLGCQLIEYDVREFVHDKGRECDVHMRFEVRVRLRP